MGLYKDEKRLVIPLKSRVHVTHGGLHPFDPPGKEYAPPVANDGGSYFLLLRDARKVITSNWFWTKLALSRTPEHMIPEHLKDGVPELTDYIRGPMGLERFQRWMRAVAGLPFSGIFYQEDGPSPIIEAMPEILTLDYKPTKDIVAKTLELNEEVINLVGADHSKTLKKDKDYIQRHLKKDCALAPYAERYL